MLTQHATFNSAHTWKEVIALIQRIAESKGVSQSVLSGWWTRFSRRHPDLALCTAVPVSYARAMANDPDVINRYYDILEAEAPERKKEEGGSLRRAKRAAKNRVPNYYS